MSKVNSVKSREVKLTLCDGVERTLKFDLNALAELEDKYGSVEKAMNKLDEGSLKAVRTVLWAGFIHESPELTETQVGSLIDIDSLADVCTKIVEAFGQDMPEAPKDANGNVNPN